VWVHGRLEGAGVGPGEGVPEQSSGEDVGKATAADFCFGEIQYPNWIARLSPQKSHIQCNLYP